MFHVPEPNINPNIPKPEKAFREAVTKALEEILNYKKAKDQLIEYCILQDFGLDIAVFIEWPNNLYTVQFFELKAYVESRPGGVGLSPTQVNILELENTKLKLLNQFVRWLLVDGTKQRGSKRFIIFDNIQAKNAVMGKLKKEKTNNLRIGDLTKNAITWKDFLNELNKILKPPI